MILSDQGYDPNTDRDLLSWGRNIDGQCTPCVGPYQVWNQEYYDENQGCKPVVIYNRKYPEYSYVYTYENKTTPGNITYPEYDIETTRW